MEGYLVMDYKGAILTQDLGAYANRIKRTEFATWILNCFYALDSYYPQAFCLLMRYASGHLYLTRTDDRIITVMCRRGADIQTLDNAFSKHRKAMAKSNTSGVVREKSQKGETVFLKISETGAGATKSPMPQKQNPPIGLIIGVVAICGVIGIAALQLGRKVETPEQPTPALVVDKTPQTQPAPTPDAPTQASEITNIQHTETSAALARDRASALARIANQQGAGELDAMDMARAIATSQSALQKFNAQDYVAAVDLWNQAASAYGRAAVKSAEHNFNLSLQKANLSDIRNYPTTDWIAIESAIKDAKQSAQDGNFTDAVSSINTQSPKIATLKPQLIAQLDSLASNAASAHNLPSALELYHKIVLIDPDNQAAKDFIYRNRYKPGEIVNNSQGMSFAYIPPGQFQRGSPDTESFRDTDETQAEITITAGYFMATTEVSQDQWERVMGQPVRIETADENFIGGSLPVHSITWAQAQDFCRRLSELEKRTYRLPTEAEWEYAARAGTKTPYNTGGNRLTGREANIYDPSGEGLDSISAVGSVGMPNAWGLHDMHGNVAEWTQDWSAPYPDDAQTDPKGPSESEVRVDLSMKIVRGGSFMDDAYLARSANRSEASPVVANSYIGFRPVLEVADF